MQQYQWAGQNASELSAEVCIVSLSVQLMPHFREITEADASNKRRKARSGGTRFVHDSRPVGPGCAASSTNKSILCLPFIDHPSHRPTSYYFPFSQSLCLQNNLKNRAWLKPAAFTSYLICPDKPGGINTAKVQKTLSEHLKPLITVALICMVWARLHIKHWKTQPL